MPYEPRNPHHLRYASEMKATGEEGEKLLETIKDYTLKLNIALGYDFNTVEFAVRDGIPIAIDFCNPAPDADIYSVGRDNFEWVVEAAANMAIERAQAQVPGQTNLTWGTFVKDALGIPAVAAPALATPTPEAAPASAKEVKLKAVTPKKSVKLEEDKGNQPVPSEPAPKIPTKKASVTKAPAANSKLKKS